MAKKDGDHSQKKVMNRNWKKPKICPVEGWIAIIERFLRLHKDENENDLLDRPLTIFYDKKTNSIKNITDFMVTTEMRELAKELYQMDDE